MRPLPFALHIAHLNLPILTEAVPDRILVRLHSAREVLGLLLVPPPKDRPHEEPKKAISFFDGSVHSPLEARSLSYLRRLTDINLD